MKIPKKRVLVTLDKQIHFNGKKRSKKLNYSFSNFVETLIDYEIANPRLAEIKIRKKRKKI